MFRILIDGDLILEAVMNRTEFTADVSKLLEIVDPSIQLYLTNVGLHKIYAYAACLKNRQMADTVVDWLVGKIKICIVDQSIMHTARLSPLKDFESAVEVVCLQHYQLDAIITNQPEDFRGVVNRFYIWSFRDLWLRVTLETQLQVSF
ncbi:hypothetical protein [Nostoc sp. UHCC 0870]|uniref:hypothetical protein n=1 Tax=Nostoc sp. UHCC 0870 TaxID=2914041 RepID=UPI001EDE1AA0|nr:hypothetical protein [Nostoc sp. UHCC 0870]UKO97635.1 hypothetical protein L6494_24180 [Nostoc sp. UHCC 0870]